MSPTSSPTNVAAVGAHEREVNGACPSERPTVGAMLAGPPVVFLLGPALFLVLMLAGSFACLFALLVALTGAILAAPYLLVRHRRRNRVRHASIGAPAAQPVAIESPRAAE